MTIEKVKEYQFVQLLISEHGQREDLLELEREVTEYIWKDLYPFTYKICKMVFNGDPNEIINSCFKSLKDSLEKYDIDSPMKFTSYYAWIIKRDLAVELSNFAHVKIPSRLNSLIYRYKRDKPENIDEWLKPIMDKDGFKTSDYENTKRNILKYSNMRYVRENNEELQSQYMKQDSFEDELLDKLSIPTEIFNDMVKVIGETYSNIIVESMANGLNYREIAEKLGCTRSNIHKKAKIAIEKLQKSDWFCNKYKNWGF